MGSVPTKGRRSAKQGVTVAPPVPVQQVQHVETIVSVLGETGSGKSSLMVAEEETDENVYSQTRKGNAYLSRFSTSKDCTYVRKSISVIAGYGKEIEIGVNMHEEGYVTYRGCNGTPTRAIGQSHVIWIVIDVNREEEYKNLNNWYKEIDRYAPERPTIIVGTKADLQGTQFRLTKEMLADDGFLDLRPNIWYFETSFSWKEDMKVLHLATALISFFPSDNLNYGDSLLEGVNQQDWRWKFCPEMFIYDDYRIHRSWIVVLRELVVLKRANPTKKDPTAQLMMAIFSLPLDIFKYIVGFL